MATSGGRVTAPAGCCRGPGTSGSCSPATCWLLCLLPASGCYPPRLLAGCCSVARMTSSSLGSGARISRSPWSRRFCTASPDRIEPWGRDTDQLPSGARSDE